MNCFIKRFRCIVCYNEPCYKEVQVYCVCGVWSRSSLFAKVSPMWWVNPHPYQLDESISNFRGIWYVFIFISSPEQRSGRAVVLPQVSASAVSKFLGLLILFPDPIMDLVHVWYDDKYWSKILLGTIPTPVHDLKVKVTDLNFYVKVLCQSF